MGRKKASAYVDSTTAAKMLKCSVVAMRRWAVAGKMRGRCYRRNGVWYFDREKLAPVDPLEGLV